MSNPLASYTATTTPATPSQAARTWQPTTNSIPFHPSLSPTSNAGPSTGRIYTLSHTVFLLSYFVLRFKALVEDPVRTMVEMALPLIVAQGAWCCVCLPRSGHWEARAKGLKIDESGDPTQPEGRSGTNVGSGKGSVRRKGGVGIVAGDKGKGDRLWSRMTPMVISVILTMTTLPPPLILLCILLGAPATTHTAHTSLLALHVALLVGPPLFYTHGVSAQAWREITCAFLPFDEPGVWGGVVGALVGGWLGAVPIPLDWDREWQKWPVTVLTGVWIGWAVGRTLLGPILLRDRRIDLRESDAWEHEEKLKSGSADDAGELAKQNKTR